MEESYVIGIDFGTASVRSVIIDTSTGLEKGSGVYNYSHGDNGFFYGGSNHTIVRQHPDDYINGIEHSVIEALKNAESDHDFSRDKIVGIGIDTTGTTVLPVNREGIPLALSEKFSDNINAYIWLWKDHSSSQEAELITSTAASYYPDLLKIVGGAYSSEWYWAKVLHCLNTDEEVYNNSYTWIEAVDWIPFFLSDSKEAINIKRCACAAGHKAVFNQKNGGYPPKSFLSKLHPKLASLRDTLPERVYHVGEVIENLGSDWAEKLNIPKNIPISSGAFDAHTGGIGGGIAPGVLVKTLGTSTCDLAIIDQDSDYSVEGLAGAVKDSIVPGYIGIEAGQSAVGDIFNWYISTFLEEDSFKEIEEEAKKYNPGCTGLLYLDWNNGNRTILNDQLLSGGIIGLTLHTKKAEVYRAIIEATAFGAKIILNQIEKNGIPINYIIACGGISRKSDFIMQLYADILEKEIKISNREYTCALGAGIAAAVSAGIYTDFSSAIMEMTEYKEKSYIPNQNNIKIYNQVYSLYKKLHDAFGTDKDFNLYHVMKELIEIKESNI